MSPADRAGYEDKYPHLLQPTVWSWGPTKAAFLILNDLPPHHWIAPHLPHHDFHRMVGTGEVDLTQAPENPPASERVAQVMQFSLEKPVINFNRSGGTT
jgi:hypothetical protein